MLINQSHEKQKQREKGATSARRDVKSRGTWWGLLQLPGKLVNTAPSGGKKDETHFKESENRPIKKST